MEKVRRVVFKEDSWTHRLLFAAAWFVVSLLTCLAGLTFGNKFVFWSFDIGLGPVGWITVGFYPGLLISIGQGVLLRLRNPKMPLLTWVIGISAIYLLLSWIGYLSLGAIFIAPLLGFQGITLQGFFSVRLLYYWIVTGLGLALAYNYYGLLLFFNFLSEPEVIDQSAVNFASMIFAIGTTLGILFIGQKDESQTVLPNEPAQ